MEKVDKMIKDLDKTNNTLNDILTNSGGIFGSGAIPMEKVTGAIDKFQEEANTRKKEINDLRVLTEYSENAIRDEFDYRIKLAKKDIGITHDNLVNKIAKNSRELKEEINEIRNMLVSFIVISIFLTIGFIYCIINL